MCGETALHGCLCVCVWDFFAGSYAFVSVSLFYGICVCVSLFYGMCVCVCVSLMCACVCVPCVFVSPLSVCACLFYGVCEFASAFACVPLRVPLCFCLGVCVCDYFECVSVCVSLYECMCAPRWKCGSFFFFCMCGYSSVCVSISVTMCVCVCPSMYAPLLH